MAYCVPLGLPHSEFLRWPDDDQDKALAWLAAERAKCSRCHTTDAQWDPKQGGSRFAFVADVSRCAGCEVLDQANRDLANQDDTHGIRIGLVRNDDDPSKE